MKNTTPTFANDNADPWSSIGWQAKLILNRLRQIQKMSDWLNQRPEQVEADPDQHQHRNENAGDDEQGLKDGDQDFAA